MLIRLGTSLFRWLASLRLAVTLLVLLALVLSGATMVETHYGAHHARWFVYEAPWFVGLLALLGVNIFCAAAIRFPWKRYQTGFVVTHAGLLVLLTGSILTFVAGVEGRVSLTEGASTDRMVNARRSQIRASWVGRAQEPAYEFAFDSGPVEWQASRSLQLGAVDGVEARVLRYLQRPRPVESWVADATRQNGPAVQFKVAGADGVTVAQSWLVDQQYGDGARIGPLRLQLERAVTDAMLQDFLQPPDQELGEQGLLAIYYDGIVQHAAVEQHVGKRFGLGASAATVEIAEYLPNAVPDPRGNFASKGDQPKNPMLELRVHIAGKNKPFRQIAFAKDALLNLDGVYAEICPVKFRYYHPAAKPKSGLELMQTSDGKLYGRLCSDGIYRSLGEMTPGQKVLAGGNFELHIVEHLPHAIQKVTFETDDTPGKTKGKQQLEPAALVELKAGGTTEQFWMRRNDPFFGQHTLATRDGQLAIRFENASIPLGFSIQLVDFQRAVNPGNAGNAAFTSVVQVTSPHTNQTREQVIAMNEPLTVGKFTFYQSGFEDRQTGRESSRFSVAYDPGRPLKYVGSLMITLGIAIMFYMRAYFFKKSRESSDESTVDEQAVVRGSARELDWGSAA